MIRGLCCAVVPQSADVACAATGTFFLRRASKLQLTIGLRLAEFYVNRSGPRISRQ
jgi:hypothetical protein